MDSWSRWWQNSCFLCPGLLNYWAPSAQPLHQINSSGSQSREKLHMESILSKHTVWACKSIVTNPLPQECRDSARQLLIWGNWQVSPPPEISVKSMVYYCNMYMLEFYTWHSAQGLPLPSLNSQMMLISFPCSWDVLCMGDVLSQCPEEITCHTTAVHCI